MNILRYFIPAFHGSLPNKVAFLVLFLFVSNIIPALGADTPPDNVVSMALDNVHSRAFLMNDDGSLSVYDAARQSFLVSRLPIPGSSLQFFSTITASSHGSFVAIMSAFGLYRQISIFKTSDLIEQESVLPVVIYTFPREKKGDMNVAFAQDEKTVFFAYGDTLHFLSTEERKQGALIIGGTLGRIVSTGLDRIAVLHEDTGAITVIDAPHQRIVKTIEVGSIPLQAVYNTITKKLYVTHKWSDDLSVIDLQNATREGSIRVGKNPSSLAVNTQNGDIFVAHGTEGAMSIIDKNNRVKTFNLDSSLGTGYLPPLFSFLNQDQRLLVINPQAHTFALYDVRNLTVIASGNLEFSPVGAFASEATGSFLIRSVDGTLTLMNASGAMNRIARSSSVGQSYFANPRGIYAANEADKIFVMNIGSNMVTVIDASTQKPIAKILVNDSPRGAVFLNAAQKLYIFSPSSKSIVVADMTKPGYPTKNIAIPSHPMGININQKTKRIYVAAEDNAGIVVIDGDTDQIIAIISLPEKSFPHSVSINEDLNMVYVGLNGRNALAVIDGKTNILQPEIPIGRGAIKNQYLFAINRLAVIAEGESNLFMIDPEINKIAQMIPLSGNPSHMFYDERTNNIYVNFYKEADRVAILTRKKHSTDFEVSKEIALPYWDKANGRRYVRVAVDTKRHLAYFTSSRNNEVVIVRDELDSKGIKKPLYYATILASGEVKFSETDREESETSESFRSFLKKNYQYLVGGGFLFLLIILASVRVLKKKPNALPPSF